MDYKLISALGLGALALKNYTRRDIKDVREDESINQQTPNTNMSGFNSTSMNQSGMNMSDNNQDLSDYISNQYGITFEYPSDWRRNPRYENKYEGANGFFEVSGFEATSNNIDNAIMEQIDEAYKPYGSMPSVERLTVAGQPARQIISSEDQGEIITDRDAALVVQYRRPVTIANKRYQYVVVWTTRENMPLLIRTFRFLNN